MARLLGALRLGGGEKKRPSSMQPLKSGESLEQKLGGEGAAKPAMSGDQPPAGGKPLPKAPSAPQAKVRPSPLSRAAASDLSPARLQSAAPPSGNAKVFGAPLEELMARHPGAKVPPLVRDLLGYLRTHGTRPDSSQAAPDDDGQASPSTACSASRATTANSSA